MSLYESTVGQNLEVTEILIDGELGLRLLELGLTRGAPIKVIRRLAFGDPILVEFRGTIVALRKDEARAVRVQMV